MTSRNPFPDDPDRSAIWDMLVHRDIAAYVAADWSMVADDFLPEAFLGIDGRGADNPDGWRISFPTLQDYETEWLHQARAGQATAYDEDVEEALHRATRLDHIEINGDRAVAHKQFDGTIARTDGTEDRLNWQTLYFCQRVGGVWKLTGFVGYLPFPMGQPGAR